MSHCEHRCHTWWIPAPRCFGCGHRVPGPDETAPRQTRELPAVLWPFELAARGEARLRGYLIRKGRL